MYFDVHTDYLNQHQEGIRKISFRTQRPKITKALDLEFLNTTKSYDLYFSKSGKLTNSYLYRYQDNRIHEVIKNTYSYSKEGRILFILSMNHLTNVLKEQIEFEYDELGRIDRETIMHYFSWNSGYYVQEYDHFYKDRYHKVEFNDMGKEDDVECVSEEWYNEKGDVVEQKFWSSEVGIHYWSRFIFDESGKLIKEFDVNDDGIAIESEIKDYKWETRVEEGKGIIRNTHLRDGEPIYIEQKTMEYYEKTAI